MFLVNPGIWIGVTVLLLVILMAISIVPLFGQIAAHLLVPLFGAGMFRVCRRMSSNEEPEISDLFAGFHHQAGQLVMVGVFRRRHLRHCLPCLPAGQRRRARRGGHRQGGRLRHCLRRRHARRPARPGAVRSGHHGDLVRPGAGLFHDMKPLDAMKASFAAGAKNWLAMCIFGIFLVVALFFAMLPVAMGLLLFLPVFSGAVYASYRDIFMGS
jgi:hypothetical protein